MKWIQFALLLFPLFLIGQTSIRGELVQKMPLEVDRIEGVDNFGTLYYTKNNIFYKKSNTSEINYSNVQLGNVTSTNTFNPLKMLLFYKDFNTVIILDNRLAEIFKIDFNTTNPYKNVSHISTGNDNTLWLFNMDNQKLELYDYKTKKVRATTVPVSSQVLDITSNYNFCWLLTQNYLYKYNYFGSMVQKIPNDGYSKISMFNETIYLKKENTLFLLDKNFKLLIPLSLGDLLINQFFVTNETLYIYDSKFLNQIHLKSN